MQDQIKKYGLVALPYLVKYRYIFIALAIIGVFIYAIVRIDSELNLERDEQAYEAQLVEVKEVKFNQEALEQIRTLKDSGATIEEQVPGSRDNPFN